jgi:hypothetical protein
MAGSIEWPLGAPGSDTAIKNGCSCPVLSNGHGRGAFGDGAQYGWWQSYACPVHGRDGTGRGIQETTVVTDGDGAAAMRGAR